MESLSPRHQRAPLIRFQPSMLSVPSSAATVRPEESAGPSAPLSPKRTAWRKLWFFTAVSALIGGGGGSLLRAPAESVSPRVHCGSPAVKTSKAGRQLHWPHQGVTVYLDGSLSRLGPAGNEAVMQAFGQWVGSDPKLPSLSFDTGRTSTEPKRDGKSTVSYATITTPGHERDVAITITYSNDDTGEIVEADVILNALYPMAVLDDKASGSDEHNASTRHNGNSSADDSSADDSSADDNSERMNSQVEDCQNRYDAQNVATHEAGHFFGLGEDATERNATMFLSIEKCETHKRLLSPTDVSAVATLYAASQDPEEAKAGCSFGAAPGSSGSLAVSGLVLGLGLWRRRSAGRARHAGAHRAMPCVQLNAG